MCRPNYKVIGPNLRFFKSLGVAGLYEEGDGFARGGEQAELKAYLVSKLMWDPSLDDMVLTQKFVELYFGKLVAPFIVRYMRLFIEAANATATFLDPEDNCIPGPAACAGKMQYLQPGALLQSISIFQDAAAAVEPDPAKQLRLQVAALPTLYVVLLRWQYVLDWADANGQPWLLSRNISVVYGDFADVYRRNGMDIGVWCRDEACVSPQRDNALGEWTGAGLAWFKKQIGAHNV